MTAQAKRLATSPPLIPIGCDVGKASIVVFDTRDNTIRDIPNRPGELAGLAASLDATCIA